MPSVPDEQKGPPMFPTQRFSRAGATAEQLATLEQDYADLTPEGQASEDQRLAALDESGLRTILAGFTAPVPDADTSVEDLLAGEGGVAGSGDSD
jgi:hypothetical protein